MNSTDIHERRRLTAAILKQKFGNPHGFQHHRHYQRHIEEKYEGEDNEEEEEEYIDCVKQQQAVQAAPSNRVERYVPVTRDTVDSRPPAPLEQRLQPPGAQEANKYLLDSTNHREQQHSGHHGGRGGGGGGRRQPSLKPVLETSESGAVPLPRPHRDHHRRLAAGATAKVKSSPSSKISAQQTRDTNSQQRQQVELVNEVKRRLSLPSDTSIPNSFLIKHKDRLNEFKLDPEAPLSRLDRRQSLFEIGYGRASTYSKLHVLGAGTYSIVYKGASRLTNRLVALKEIHLERDEGVPFTAIREVSLLKQLKHCNIITLHDIIYTSKTLTLVFEYVERDLSRYMDECDQKIEPANVRMYLFQLLRALAYCHARKILHRDIKPQNILISASGELKLADFGLARAKSFPTKTYTDEVVTLWYRPPDVLLGNVDYGPCIDMWGVGCIFFEMLAGFTLFLGTDPCKQINCIFEILGTPDESTWPGIRADLECNDIDLPAAAAAAAGRPHNEESQRSLVSLAPQLQGQERATDLLERLLKCNPKQRISSACALRHEYFSSFPKAIYDLHDSVSIFSLADVKLRPESHMRSNHYVQSTTTSSSASHQGNRSNSNNNSNSNHQLKSCR